MDSVTREDYTYLKGILVNASVGHINLHNLKLKYKKDINSSRRMDCIKSVNDLVRLLEKRACVSEKNIKVLEEIAVVINNQQYLNEIRRRQNLTYQAPVPNLIDINVKYSDAMDIKDQIHELIISEIGVKWVEFARALKVKENKLDELKMKYCNNVESSVKEVLVFHTKNVSPRDWKQKLLDALTKARRNDLRRDVEKLYINFT